MSYSIKSKEHHNNIGSDLGDLLLNDISHEKVGSAAIGGLVGGGIGGLAGASLKADSSKKRWRNTIIGAGIGAGVGAGAGSLLRRGGGGGGGIPVTHSSNFNFTKGNNRIAVKDGKMFMMNAKGDIHIIKNPPKDLYNRVSRKSIQIPSGGNHNLSPDELLRRINKAGLKKTSAVFGAHAPDLVNSEHAGIPYNTRKRAYKNYAQVKAQEPKTGWGTSLATGGVVGGLLGAAASGGRGSGVLGGALVGGLVGGVMKASDDIEINEARRAIRGGKGVADEVMAHRMARHARMERSQDRAEARSNALMIAGAVRSRPTRVNNYRTQINQVNMSNRTTNIRNSKTTLNRF